MSSSWQADKDNMMVAFGQTVRNRVDSPPISSNEIKLRVALIKEEAKELTDALEGGDFVGAADGIVDLLVVTIGAASALGINIDPLWDEVYENNMELPRKQRLIWNPNLLWVGLLFFVGANGIGNISNASEFLYFQF